MSTIERSKRPEHLHQNRMLHAIQTGAEVCYRGQSRHIQDFGLSLYGGGLRFMLYLTGDPNPVDATEVELLAQPT